MSFGPVTGFYGIILMAVRKRKSVHPFSQTRRRKTIPKSLSSRPDVRGLVESLPLMDFVVVIFNACTSQRRKKNKMQTKISHMPSITSTFTTETLLILHASE